MKTVKLFITAMFVFMFGLTTSAQTHDQMNMDMTSSKTESFKVWGNCEMCKTRIEKAVKDAGASDASWDQETKILAVTFDPSKTNLDAFNKKLASVGHDTENLKADDKVYNALPDCCKYDRAPLAKKVDYTCPMHSDVHSDKPGKCSKCGMALVKTEVSKPGSDHSQHSMEGMHKK